MSWGMARWAVAFILFCSGAAHCQKVQHAHSAAGGQQDVGTSSKS